MERPNGRTEESGRGKGEGRGGGGAKEDSKHLKIEIFEGKRKKNNGKFLPGFARPWQKVQFFRAASSRVNANTKCFLLKLRGGQEERKMFAFLSSK